MVDIVEISEKLMALMEEVDDLAPSRICSILYTKIEEANLWARELIRLKVVQAEINDLPAHIGIERQ